MNNTDHLADHCLAIYFFFHPAGVESKTEGVSSSCLLTPTASPRHAGISEECPVNGEVSSEG